MSAMAATVTTRERGAEARRLRADGLTWREVANVLRAPRSTVHQWATDPDGTRARARKQQYEGVCDLCGGPTNGSNGPDKAPDLCARCRRWDDDAIIDAIRRWAHEHGGIPPTCTEWRLADTHHPCASVVQKHFGWNEALLRAGFALRCDRRPETHAQIVDRLRAGERTEDIARSLGVSTSAIYRRMHYRGIPVSELRMRYAPTARFVELWQAGTPISEIAAELRMVEGSVINRAAALRKRGYDLPRRKRGRKRGPR